jgi:hypothetical protein
VLRPRFDCHTTAIRLPLLSHHIHIISAFRRPEP